MRQLIKAPLLFAALLTLGGGSGTAAAQSEPGIQTAVADPHAAFIAEASRRFGIPEQWIRAVLRAESRGEVRALSAAGAIGLMQVMPETWASLRSRHGFGRDPYDPRDNILAGAAYMREMWDRYGNVAAMLAAYNAGPGRYDEYLATGRILPAETRAYVSALAPLLGGEASPAVSTQPADWREAPLFVTRPTDMQAGAAPSPVVPPGDTRTTVPARDPAVTGPQDGSIFVARASDGRTP